MHFDYDAEAEPVLALNKRGLAKDIVWPQVLAEPPEIQRLLLTPDLDAFDRIMKRFPNWFMNRPPASQVPFSLLTWLNRELELSHADEPLVPSLNRHGVDAAQELGLTTIYADAHGSHQDIRELLDALIGRLPTFGMEVTFIDKQCLIVFLDCSIPIQENAPITREAIEEIDLHEPIIYLVEKQFVNLNT